MDSFSEEKTPKLIEKKEGGQRVATMLMYLSDVEVGGETVFPYIPAPEDQPEGVSPCADQGLSVHPRRGDALLFYNLDMDGEVERQTLHGKFTLLLYDSYVSIRIPLTLYCFFLLFWFCFYECSFVSRVEGSQVECYQVDASVRKILIDIDFWPHIIKHVSTG